MVHGDPTRSNVFYDGRSVKLIDWEFVRYDHKETDLVFFAYSYDLSKKLWRLFLENYGYPDTAMSKRILNLFFISHYISMINWRFERLHFLSVGKADLRQSSSNRSMLIKEIEEDLVKSRNILNKY